MTSNKKAIWGCLLSLALSGFCVYSMYIARNVEPTMKLHISDKQALNAFIDYMIRFYEKLDGRGLLTVGIVGLAFYISFNDSLHEMFSKVPLGSIKKYNYFVEPKKTLPQIMTALLPSWIIGIFVMVYVIVNKFFHDRLDEVVKWGLPSTILLTLIILFTGFIFILRDGGLWGLLIRAPLLLCTNLCLAGILVPLIVIGGGLALYLSVSMLFVIFFLPILLYMLRRL